MFDTAAHLHQRAVADFIQFSCFTSALGTCEIELYGSSTAVPFTRVSFFFFFLEVECLRFYRSDPPANNARFGFCRLGLEGEVDGCV